jgi:hypothetical protein
MTINDYPMPQAPSALLPVRIGAIGAALACGLMVSACAHPDDLRVGMTRAELDAQFGKPSAERHDVTADGSDDVRIYTSAPLGQRASAAHIGPDGRVTAVEPLLNIPHFATIRVDRWTMNDVLAHFGKPSEISATREYPTVWGYRYREAETWNSMFSVMFDAAGVVRLTQNGPDEMYDPTNGREH